MSWKRWFYWLIGGGVIGGVVGVVIVIALSSISNGPCAARNPYIPWWVGQFLCPPLVAIHSFLLLPIVYAIAVGFIQVFPFDAASTAAVMEMWATQFWGVVGVLMGIMAGTLVSYLKIAKKK